MKVKGDSRSYGIRCVADVRDYCRTVIDLRSDTVSKPTDEMRAAMAAAPVGDDVFGDDPSVQSLETYVADLLGQEAAVFVTSGTQSNLCALMAHCGRGDEYIAGDNSHMIKYEAGGGAVLGSISPQTVPMMADGSLDLDRVEAAIKPDDSHFARTRMLCVENTHDGKPQTVAQMEAAAEVGRRHGLTMHLDGARLWNAAAALAVSPASLAAPFDTVSVCLSKGLGAPVGSVLAGSVDKIAEARKWRKMLGGGLRQAGIIAAAGQHAVEHHRARLVDDHTNAEALATGLDGLPAGRRGLCPGNGGSRRGREGGRGPDATGDAPRSQHYGHRDDDCRLSICPGGRLTTTVWAAAQLRGLPGEPADGVALWRHVLLISFFSPEQRYLDEPTPRTNWRPLRR